MRGCVNKQILYHGDNGGLRSGRVEGYDIDSEHLSIFEEAPITFNRVVATSISDHRHVGLGVVVLSDADDIEAMHYAGQVITVFDNGFYELELLTKVNFRLDSDYRIHSDIEPRQIIVNKNVSMIDGGFRFYQQDGINFIPLAR